MLVLVLMLHWALVAERTNGRLQRWRSCWGDAGVEADGECGCRLTGSWQRRLFFPPLAAPSLLLGLPVQDQGVMRPCIRPYSPLVGIRAQSKHQNTVLEHCMSECMQSPLARSLRIVTITKISSVLVAIIDEPWFTKKLSGTALAMPIIDSRYLYVCVCFNNL